MMSKLRFQEGEGGDDEDTLDICLAPVMVSTLCFQGWGGKMFPRNDTGPGSEGRDGALGSCRMLDNRRGNARHRRTNAIQGVD
jgi:hypothetical protein